MLTKSIFAVSINDIMQQNKFFQCFVCLQQFNETKNFPMQICDQQHFMCKQCVDSNMFKKNPLEGGYLCNLCSLNVDKTKARKSPFLLSIKKFIEELVEREKIRKEKYKECMEKQMQFVEELINQNIAKTQKIEELEQKINQQEQMMTFMLEKTDHENLNNCISEINSLESQVLPPSLLMSKIGFSQEEQNQPQNKKKQLPEGFRSMLKEIEYMKAQIEENQQIDKEEYQKRIQQLQRHQNYLYQIVENENNS